ncbi:MAG: 2-C-methyl-D-erythritol 2,4-cyclodiphosphate synthase [Candidatus Cloacimonadaceae bacterium]|nr:2-C-methyl-D-erythritol 2,4-cyclodiphosphate synthase [Candidatus Cloacimonadaceae bacterium]
MFRIGIGYDVHRMKPGRNLILGGVEIPFDQGLDGHSDADVLIHAIIDAILGSLALGDIGSHFPDSDPAYKGIDSSVLLQKCVSLMREKSYDIVNLDSTICAKAPKLRAHIDAMRARLAEILNIDADLISIKATTEEGLGVSGCGEGMSATCVVLVGKV